MKTLIWGMFAAALIGISGAFALHSIRPSPPETALPILGTLPEFSLINETGAPVTLKSLEGSPWIADFIYTHCPGQCPLLSQRMERLQALLPAESHLQLISISVDPSRDTPAVLANYGRQYHAQKGRWHFLTGKESEVARLMEQGFKLASDGTMIHHSEKMVLVDSQGHIRGYYDALDDQDLRRLVAEISREGSAL